jgi:hypothetical protein
VCSRILDELSEHRQTKGVSISTLPYGSADGLQHLAAVLFYSRMYL